MTVPYWVQDAIFYQIFPDRFANGDQTNDPINVQPWGQKPDQWGFQGGDLRGIMQKMDYLLDLGVNTIYLNPIFLSPSSHRYNTVDYYKIDPKLGDMKDFEAFLDLAHRNNIRVLLDGVFNHCGRGFFAFSDLLENGEHSPYKDWFHVKHFPLNAYTHGDAENYLAWWNIKSLPKFNTSNRQVRKYIMDIAKYWIERGIDGWRLDVPGEIDDDDFWAEFRQVVKTANRDAYLLGEIWQADARWANDSHFDGLMNYPVKDALLPLLNGQGDVNEFASKIDSLFHIYSRENLYAMYVPLDSHDTERALTTLGGDLNKLKTAFQFIFAFPGAPAIYYGDEVGLEGAADPDCRRAFPWDTSTWKNDLHDWMRELIKIRKNRPSLRRGDFQRIDIPDSQGLYASLRALGSEKTLMLMNASPHKQQINLSIETIWQNNETIRDLLINKAYEINNGKLEINISAWSAIWLGN